ncbi:MAG TPA: isoprenylcysteine carboxylmethyltransferase family protein [Anaerolineae bacterium]|nr:isoprenylcysteine carboxylmethyltransferase family protein [Anaerolineae bacterium]
MNVTAVYILSASLLLVAAVIIFRIFIRRDYFRRGRLTIFSSSLQALIFFVYGGFPSIYLPDDWPVSHMNSVLRFIGLALITIGLTTLLIGMFYLGIARSLGQQTGILRQSGLYRLTRNPQVLGCGLYITGFALLWPSWYALGWAILFIPMIHLMVLTEEEHLRREHGMEYERYIERVVRYLGFPKKG